MREFYLIFGGVIFIVALAWLDLWLYFRAYCRALKEIVKEVDRLRLAEIKRLRAGGISGEMQKLVDKLMRVTEEVRERWEKKAQEFLPSYEERLKKIEKTIEWAGPMIQVRPERDLKAAKEDWNESKGEEARSSGEFRDEGSVAGREEAGSSQKPEGTQP